MCKSRFPQLRQTLNTCGDADAKVVVQTILILGREDKALVVCMPCRWWDRRNKVNVGEQDCAVATKASHARSRTLEFMQAIARPTSLLVDDT